MDITRSFIETAVNKALQDILRDPRRSIRNIVDLGSNFSKGRFQRHFLDTAQTLLKSGDSAYYELASRVAREIDHDTIKGFGINLGYNGFTKGAKTIRTNESVLRVNIPWLISLAYERDGDGPTIEELSELIEAGKALGIFAYVVTAEGSDIADAGKLFETHSDCAFLFVVREGMRDAAPLSALSKYKNIMAVIPADDPLFEARAAVLRRERCLYAAYMRYADARVAEILDMAWLERLAEAGCTFALLIAEDECSEEAQLLVYEHVLEVRQQQRYAIFPMDFYSDTFYIDCIISQQPCFFGVNERGEVYTQRPRSYMGENIRERPLLDILMRTMPRVTYLNGQA